MFLKQKISGAWFLKFYKQFVDKNPDRKQARKMGGRFLVVWPFLFSATNLFKFAPHPCFV
jgi:hypothetical protein